MMTCSFCGKTFNKDSTSKSCQTCTIFGGCKKLKCPFCGYEMPAELKLLSWFTRIFASKKCPAPVETCGPLCNARSNSKGVVAYLATRENSEVKKLMAMGILPGTDIRLLQRFPSYVFQVGYSQFTVDMELAKIIFVHWDHLPVAMKGAKMEKC